MMSMMILTSASGLIRLEIGHMRRLQIEMNAREHQVRDARSVRVIFGEIIREIARRRGTESEQLLKHKGGLLDAISGQQPDVGDQP